MSFLNKWYFWWGGESVTSKCISLVHELFWAEGKPRPSRLKKNFHLSLTYLRNLGREPGKRTITRKKTFLIWKTYPYNWASICLSNICSSSHLVIYPPPLWSLRPQFYPLAQASFKPQLPKLPWISYLWGSCTYKIKFIFFKIAFLSLICLMSINYYNKESRWEEGKLLPLHKVGKELMVESSL